MKKEKKLKSLDHMFLPKHELLSTEEGEKLLAGLGVTREQLPKIKTSDAGLANINCKEGDIIRIERNDSTAKNYYYRLVVK